MTTEVELKLLLPGADPATIEQRLIRLPLLAHASAQRRWLWNRYYDTPQHALRERRSALRVRCIGSQAWDGPAPQGDWVQTFKTAGVSQGGLSRRGEWEHTVTGPALSREALADTPWGAMDPDGGLFDLLQPVFDTRCRRTTWLVQTAGGDRIEIALDVGDIVAGERLQPMLELELELLSGQPGALFACAQDLAQAVAVLPFDASKAERGYALAAGTADRPVRARPTRLGAHATPTQAAQKAMGEMLDQLCRNLASLLQADDPELVHQARVGWRRWRSAARLFRPWLPAVPARTALRPLLDALAQRRDLDVAWTEVLPRWQTAYVDGDTARKAHAHAALQQLRQRSQTELERIRQHLAQVDTGATLLALAAWLHGLDTLDAPATAAPHPTPDSTPAPVPTTTAQWARDRVSKLHRRLDKALLASDAPESTLQQRHEARLLAKRTRYGVETLLDLLPTQKAQGWAQQATQAQTRIGADRDLLQTIALLHAAGAAPGWVDFLRGVVAAHATRRDR